MRKGKELTAGSTCQVYKVAIVRGTRRALVAAGRTRTLKTDFFFEKRGRNSQKSVYCDLVNKCKIKLKMYVGDAPRACCCR